MTEQQTPQLATLTALMEATDLSGYAIARYGYRQQRVVGDAVKHGPIGYDAGDEFRQLQRRLAQAAGSRPDNHETYEVVTPDGQTLYIWFHDWTVAVGTGMRPY